MITRELAEVARACGALVVGSRITLRPLVALTELEEVQLRAVQLVFLGRSALGLSLALAGAVAAARVTRYRATVLAWVVLEGGR